MKTKSIAIFSIAFVVLFYLAYYLQGITGLILLLTLGIVGLTLVAMLWIALLELIIYRNKQDIPGFIIGLLALVIVFFRPVELLAEQFKSPVVFDGTCGHGLWHNSLKLRANKTFEYNTSGFVTWESSGGSYQLNHDTLVLSFEEKLPDQPNILVKNEEGYREIDSSKIHRDNFRSSN